MDIIACMAFPFSLGLALYYWTNRRWGKRGRLACLAAFVIGRYSLMCVFSYGTVQIIGQWCDLPPDDPYYDQWGLTESALWPVMFLTGRHLPDEPCRWQ